MFPRKIILLLTITMISYYCVAQQYKVIHYTEADGLGNTTTHAATQDSAGVMWFATRAGITSYDGSTWKNYNAKDGLVRRGYAYIEVDEKGKIWALPFEGDLYLGLFSGDRWVNVLPNNSTENLGKFRALSVKYVKERPVVVVATKDNGVLVNRISNWTHYTVSNGLLSNLITAICFVHDSIFVATNEGINIIYNEEVSILDDLRLGFPDNNIIGMCSQKILNDDMGKYIVWVAGKDWLGYISDQKFILVSSNIKVTITESFNNIFLVPDNKDGIYYGNEFGIRYFDFDTKKTSNLGQKNGLISEGAISIFIDREKNEWIVGGRGVNKIPSKRFANFNKENGLFDNEVTAIEETSPGNYVFGHIGALTFYEDGKFHELELSYSSSNWHEKRVMDISIDSDNNIWFAAGLLGIGFIDKNKNVKLFREKEGFPGFATSVVSTSSGKIYACSNEGLFVFTGNKFEQRPYEGSWDQSIRKIFEAKDGSLYFTTYDKGIYKIVDGIPVNIKSQGNKGFNNTYSMWENPEGDILVGSAIGILKVKDSVLVKHEAISLERPVYMIMNDHKGQIWFGSDNGIYRWNGNDLEHFSALDGVAGQEINRDGGLLDSDNNLWFGTNNGVTLYRETFDYSNYSDIPSPKMALSFLEVRDDTLSFDEKIILDHNKHDLTFNFKGISFIDENKLYYSCKLEGFDHDWTPEFRSFQNNYRYFNLQPGEYRFCVKARNALGTWSNPICSNMIIIKSPMWSRWWFITLAIVFILFIVSVISRNISQRKYSVRLKETVQERTKELKETKERVEESEKRFKALHNASFGGIAIHDKGLILDCNQGLSDMTGYEVDELIGMNGLILIAEQSREKVLNNISSGYEKAYEAVGLHKNGNEFPMRLEARNVPYKGEMVRSVEFRDITEQKKSELEIINAKDKAEESERQLKLIANNFVNGMIYQVAMLDENKRKFNYVSDTVENLYGCSAEEAMENPDLIYGKIHPDDIDLLLAEEKKALKNMSVFNVEARVINPDGSIRWSYYVSQPRIINGIVCWDGIEVDISERKIMEIELKISKEKAEESDHLKSAFLANMSHEIRTPMNGILGFAELLKEPDLTGEQQQKYISIIEKGGARMLNIINDIVSISKIESGQIEINKQESNINKQIEFIYTFFKPEVEGKSIQFSFRNSLSSNEAILITDREKIYAILTNLVKNAIKYTDEGSIELGYSKKGNFLEFYVKDTGIGIPTGRQEAIFERFIQADIADKNAYQGAGLGLSISKAYIEMLGGKIWVESEQGGGSTFYFTLPYQTQTKVEKDTKVELLPSVKTGSIDKLKILIVEDDETSVELILIAIQKFGKEIFSVKTGAEAVEICINNPDIDLILMDIQLPEMDGYAATRLIRKFNKDVVIIAQTAYALSGDKEKAIVAGCDDYISKPINADLLKKKIAKCFKKL